MSTESRTVPPLLLERLALGELPSAQERALRQEFGDAVIDGELKLLRQSDATLRAQSRPAVARIEQRVAAQRDAARTARLRRLGLSLTPALAAAAAIYLAVVPGPGAAPTGSMPEAAGPTGHSRHSGQSGQEPLEPTRVKGDPGTKVADAGARAKPPQLLVYRRVVEAGKEADPAIEQLQGGATVRAGDVLQLGYDNGHRYGALFSLDGRGQVTLHYPDSATAEPRLDRAEALLGFAYELDDSPAFERFFFVTGDAPFVVKDVLAAAQKLGRDPKRAADPKAGLPLRSPLQSTLTVTSLMLNKVAR